MSTNDIALCTLLLIFFLIAAGMFAAFAILLSPPIFIMIPLVIGFGAILVSVFLIFLILTTK